MKWDSNYTMSAQLLLSTKTRKCLDNFTLSIESLSALRFLISNDQLFVKQSLVSFLLLMVVFFLMVWICFFHMYFFLYHAFRSVVVNFTVLKSRSQNRWSWKSSECHQLQWYVTRSKFSTRHLNGNAFKQQYSDYIWLVKQKAWENLP